MAAVQRMRCRLPTRLAAVGAASSHSVRTAPCWRSSACSLCGPDCTLAAGLGIRTTTANETVGNGLQPTPGVFSTWGVFGERLKLPGIFFTAVSA
eukprot:4877392-Prymnesium_polylepis.1